MVLPSTVPRSELVDAGTVWYGMAPVLRADDLGQGTHKITVPRILITTQRICRRHSHSHWISQTLPHLITTFSISPILVKKTFLYGKSFDCTPPPHSPSKTLDLATDTFLEMKQLLGEPSSVHFRQKMSSLSPFLLSLLLTCLPRLPPLLSPLNPENYT